MTKPSDPRCVRLLAVANGLIDDTDEGVRNARRHIGTCPVCAGAFESDDPTLPKLFQPAKSLRIILVVVSVLQTTFAVRWLFGATWLDSEVTAAHLTRDGALGLAIAAIGVTAATRPRSARGLLGVGCVVLIVQAVAGAVDEQAGWVHLPFEGVHLFNAMILGLVFVISLRQRQTLSGPTARQRSRLRVLKPSKDEVQVRTPARTRQPSR
jgi:hypothetical protein